MPGVKKMKIKGKRVMITDDAAEYAEDEFDEHNIVDDEPRPLIDSGSKINKPKKGTGAS